ncbi:pleckstrin homology domain-containing family G member 3-like [Echeneis naucrates]|uniref:pleckstrin homology domain-containing family G member 3-like n=1 Tax=Echeneis naucrates TaxID=173247 RepID=UPI00111447C0|nr:pleckstrin homology domain-containing family G member 3 [Echeneis naucrates]
MGYQRSVWRSLGGGGGGGSDVVVRCSCSKEEVKISFRSAGEDRRLRRIFVRRWFGGHSVFLLFRYLVKSMDQELSESPHLSTAPISNNECALSATPSDSNLSSDRRPVSLIPTLSSGSRSYGDDSPAPVPASAQTPPPDINLDLRPVEEREGGAEGEGSRPCPQSVKKGWGLDIINTNNNKDLMTTQTSSRWHPTSPFTAHSMAPNPQLTYLDRVVMEIIETERMYVRDLRMIVEDYLAHIIDQSDLSIHPEQVCALFGNIEDIYEFNSELLQALDLCDNNPVAVARCFVMKSEYFEIYTQYCTNYPNSVAALTECMRNKSLAKFFRERQALLKRSLPLGSYLLKPVQRILKYHLLLQEIAKHFDPEEEGYEVVEDAIYTMTGVAWYINDMKRKHEHAVRLQEVQSLLLNWKGPDLTTYGELVLEGTFKVHRAKNERTLFLFDRMLLITKRRGEHYVYKTHISCSTLMLIESAKDSLSFSVTHYKHPKQPHTVQAKTAEEKKLWAHHIKRIILENHHAIIPQKAKEAILEMDAIYPPRYRYSPERLKKAFSSQSEELQRDGRQGRWSSNKLSHDFSRLSPPSVNVSTESFLFPTEDKTSEADLKAEYSDPDEVLLDNQGDDFAGSVLAAIACWHSRVQDFLSSSVTEEEDGGVSEPMPEQSFTEKPLQEKTPESEPTIKIEPEASSDLDPSVMSASPQRSEEVKPEEDPEPTEEPSTASADSDSKTLSSGESSEDEDEDKEAREKHSEVTSILPSSVLDKASAIAQHFTNSIKRASLAQDVWSFGCTSPHLSTRTSSSTEPSNQSIGPDPSETSSGTDPALLSPRDEGLFDPDRGIRQRRDSILSKHDQLLIGKIKSYYENAGSQDASFSVQRRESLTYIPPGLVRSSVSRFNSIPKMQTKLSTTESCDHMVSSDSLDSLKSDQRSTEDSVESFRSRSQSLQDNPSEDEDFRPSSEMIRIWQAMEQEITRSQSEDKGQEKSMEVPIKSRATDTCVPSMNENCNGESEISEISAITQESTRPFETTRSRANGLGGLKDTLKVFGEETVFLRAATPRVTRLKVEAEQERPNKDTKQGDEFGMTKSKVLHLARQYSQKIKTTKPVVRQRSQGFLLSTKSLPCVVEEKEDPGTTRFRSPASQISQGKLSLTLGPAVRSGRVLRGRPRSHSPLSPPPTEGFNWPDVRQLRSKYSDQKSHSMPDQMFDGRLRRHSSCSSSVLLTDDVPSYNPCHGADASQAACSKRLHRANSLDPRLSGAQTAELQRLQDAVTNCNYDGYFIAAKTQLPNDPEHKVIVVEKLPEHESEPARTAEEEEVEDNSYIQIRSPTSREKISIMAVIDRCRAYQDSEEHKQREEAQAKTQPNVAPDHHDDGPQKTSWNSGLRTEAGQSIVKNLREKFQSLS